MTKPPEPTKIITSLGSLGIVMRDETNRFATHQPVPGETY